MGKKYREVKKHILIYFLFVKNNLIQYMEYKTNFFAGVLAASGFLFIRVMYVLFFYNSNISIKGITPDEIMLYMASFIILTAIYTGIMVDNFYKIPTHVQNGTLDMYITKPISLQFMTTMRHINFALPFPNLIVGLIMLVLAWRKLGIEMSIYMVAGYCLTILNSTLITYSIFLFPQLISFWTVKSGAITEIVDRTWDFNTMPMNIYNKYVQKIGVFIVPIFFISNIPTMFLLRKLTGVYIIWIFVAPIIFFILVRLFWNYAIKKYTSASS